MVIKTMLIVKVLRYFFTLFFLGSSVATVCYADGSPIDKVYLPYVQPLEQEIEYRMLAREVDGENVSQHKLGYGSWLLENWFAEFYVMGEKTEEEFVISDYEAEVKLQLTEQGEFDIDLGLMFEVEKSADADDAWEAAAGLLAVKNFNKISVAANAFLVREWGKDRMAEFEQYGAVQVRYRLAPQFEPGIELYIGEEVSAIGPVMMGRLRVASQQKLFWQLGMLFDDSNQGSNRILQLQLEYEFL
tara:strand:- start:2802 stop:3536 length:735 start_codon:yes stop_codon:yes gene_type:complete